MKLHALWTMLAAVAAGLAFISCGKAAPRAVPPSPAATSAERSAQLPQPTPQERAAFWKFWGDGNAEISSYNITQLRYGQMRHGYSVLVFVTEDISRTTRIKVESDNIPPADRVPVLKLNRVEKFPTGIYDYSLLTSTFSAIGPELGNHPFQAMKVSNTTQEWCGSFFGMWRTDPDALRYARHSYFEREGDADNVRYALPAGEWEYEDNLPILIRELAGEWMKTGETKTLELLPSFQHQRFTHDSIGFVSATVTKRDGGAITSGGAHYPATIRWTWSYTDNGESFPEGPKIVAEEYWTDAAYPHTILQWKSSDGSAGALMVSKRLPYWKQHDTAHDYLRKAFKIPGD